MGARAASRRRAARLGVFGGTFDPPHLGHLALAEWAREELGLDRVLFVPAGAPPHKRAPASSAADRVAMVRAAVRGHRAFAVDPIETRRDGPSYTADTLRALAGRHPGAQWWLLVGADMFAGMHTWHEIGSIVRLARVAVAVRPGAARPPRPAWSRGGLGVSWLRNPGLEISSSGVRARARAGRSLRYLVPDAVERIIAARGLYRAGIARAAGRHPAAKHVREG